MEVKNVPVLIWSFSTFFIAEIEVAMPLSTVFIVRPIGLTSIPP